MAKKILLVTFLILGTALIVWQFSLKIPNFTETVEFYGLSRITADELKSSLSNLKLDNKSLIEINSRRVSNYLIKHPLIEEAKTKALIFPRKHFKIYIKEASPWAYYRGQILDHNLQVLIESRAQARIFKSPALDTLYANFYNAKNNDLVNIVSYSPLSSPEIKTIKQISEIIENNLEIINYQKFKKAKDSVPELINTIKVDQEDNVIFTTTNLKFLAGRLNPAIINRVKRLDAVVPKIVEMGSEKGIEYVDLSLTTDEVIFGKPSAVVVPDKTDLSSSSHVNSVSNGVPADN